MIIPIFGPRDLASVLAHASLHCVTGLTLPPVDANSFSSTVRLARALGEDVCLGCTSLPSGSILYLVLFRMYIL
ncbi:unnamed protein product [Penicillium roqueforti FM164]|uniref:Genomic scaffold, ProqFM164S01 n=1 Tax=Penicillium roqueforti (strain FM164) TaxID=1365484 RepID=W6PTT8_PENRF|nr:unnamed protein product [Penicillium roqueforti FM164]